MQRDLTSLKATAVEVARERGIAIGDPFPLARYSLVAAAGEDAVIKATPASDDESDEEADALALWGGDGAVALLGTIRSGGCCSSVVRGPGVIWRRSRTRRRP